MDDALIGFTGFLGTTLLRQRPFEHLYASANITDIAGRSFGTIVCCGAPAQKWIANAEPDADRRNLEGLMEHLTTVRCERFVLMSTIDVFKDSTGVTEVTNVDEEGLHPYGLHRRMLERFVERQFSRRLIVRLPGLVGPGLRKNAVYDLLNDNNLDRIDRRSTFQFYPTVNLWFDVQRMLERGLDLVHLTAEPVSIVEVAREGFGREFDRVLPGKPAAYDMRSLHAAALGGRRDYQYTRRESIQAIRAYAQSELPAAHREGRATP